MVVMVNQGAQSKCARMISSTVLCIVLGMVYRGSCWGDGTIVETVSASRATTLWECAMIWGDDDRRTVVCRRGVGGEGVCEGCVGRKVYSMIAMMGRVQVRGTFEDRTKRHLTTKTTKTTKTD
jgi:hypothetical protein